AKITRPISQWNYGRLLLGSKGQSLAQLSIRESISIFLKSYIICWLSYQLIQITVNRKSHILKIGDVTS
ncbi:hypothetical protein ACFUVS_16060, partial [Bacillus velezensis]